MLNEVLNKIESTDYNLTMISVASFLGDGAH